MERDFNTLLKAQWQQRKFLCIGLDPDHEKIPLSIRTSDVAESILAFNRAIIDATKGTACAYKPNTAFYEAHGEEGIRALRETIEYALEQAPDTVVLLDAKRGDIGNTNEYYARFAFEYLHADAITLHPYTGAEGLSDFLKRKDKGLFIYCRSSNPGAKEIQDLDVGGEPLYMRIARTVAGGWNTDRNCGLIVGATYPEEMSAIRRAAPELPFLIPGVGSQGGDIARSVAAAKNTEGTGFIISVSRAILYASQGADFAGAARAKAEQFHAEIAASLL